MSNRAGETILFYLKGLPLSAEEKACAESFYQYYCKLNRLQPRTEEEQTFAP